MTTEKSYDRPGRTASAATEGAATSLGYDRNGNETSSATPSGTLTTTQYDPLNRATVVIGNDVASPNDPTEDVATTTYYDAAGRAVAIKDAAGFTSRSIYNVRGLPSTSNSNCTDSGTTPTSSPATCTGAGTHNATTNVVTTTEYDGSGAAKTIVAAVGTGTEATYEYAYDAAGRRQAINDPLGTVTRTLYDSSGRATSTIVNCTEDTSSPAPPSSSWWNCDGSSLNDGTWNVTTSRTYDAHGNIATETAPNGRVTSYGSAQSAPVARAREAPTPSASESDELNQILA